MIADLQAHRDVRIATLLIFILAFSFPIYACQRILVLIYAIRLEDYKFQRIVIIGNVLRILSTFCFFSNGKYMVVEYFLVYQIIGAFVALYGLRDVKGRYSYSWSEFRRFFRFNRSVFNRVKRVAFVSLVLTVGWVFYYEIDQLAISRLLGAKQVAVYAIALAVLTMFRTF